MLGTLKIGEKDVFTFVPVELNTEGVNLTNTTDKLLLANDADRLTGYRIHTVDKCAA